jgi:hypothetical protein
VINSADDERDPPEIWHRRARGGPAAARGIRPGNGESETRGHATLFVAKFYVARLAQFLASLPPRNARP